MKDQVAMPIKVDERFYEKKRVVIGVIELG